jgi:hypothetical protein
MEKRFEQPKASNYQCTPRCTPQRPKWRRKSSLFKTGLILDLKLPGIAALPPGKGQNIPDSGPEMVTPLAKNHEIERTDRFKSRPQLGEMGFGPPL